MIMTQEISISREYEAYQKAKKFMKELMPKNVRNIKKYR